MNHPKLLLPLFLRGMLALALLVSGCARTAPVDLSPTSAPPAPTPTAMPAVVTPSPQITASPSPRPTPSATLVPSPSPTPVTFYQPAGCLPPPETGEENQTVEINGWTLDVRTVAMLEHAQTLYNGPAEGTGGVDLLANVTQGSYHDNGAASFGTHLGGGAVDLSIFLPNTWTPDYPGLLRLVRAMRAAGFAAWVRDLDEVYPGSGMHIHAIAIGDPNLSEAAEAQLTGPAGFLRGFDGLPNETPIPDRYGGPVLCDWMIAAGYADLREADSPPAWPPPDWQTRLSALAAWAAGENITALAARLGTVPAYLEGPLAGWLLREAGLLPPAPNPARRPLNYLLSPERESAFWSWFSDDIYHRTTVASEPARGSLTPADLLLLGPLIPGDLMLLHDDPTHSVARVWVVTEVRNGQAFGPAVWRDPQGKWTVAVQALNGPNGLLSTKLYHEIALLRRVEAAVAAGLPISYVIQPGDTLPVMAARFAVSPADLLAANPGIDPAQLSVGQILKFPARE